MAASIAGRLCRKLMPAVFVFTMTTALHGVLPSNLQAETGVPESIGRWTLIALPRNLGHIAWIPADSSAADQYCRDVYLKSENWGFFSSEFLSLVRRNPVACLAIFCRMNDGHAAELGIELKLVGKTHWLREPSRQESRALAVTLHVDDDDEIAVESNPSGSDSLFVRSIDGWPAGLSELYIIDEFGADAREVFEGATRIRSDPVKGRAVELTSAFDVDIPGYAFDATGAKEMLARMDRRCQRQILAQGITTR